MATLQRAKGSAKRSRQEAADDVVDSSDAEHCKKRGRRSVSPSHDSGASWLQHEALPVPFYSIQGEAIYEAPSPTPNTHHSDTSHLPPVPAYNPWNREVERGVLGRNPSKPLLLLAGMNFTDPHSSTPLHTDDVRCRMLGYITGAQVTTIGTCGPVDPLQDAPYCIHSNIRVLSTTRHPDSDIAGVMKVCDLFILDYYYLTPNYFATDEGYGNRWFNDDGPIVDLLSHKCQAVIMPVDIHGNVLRLLEANRANLQAKHGIVAPRTSSRCNPLAVATK